MLPDSAPVTYVQHFHPRLVPRTAPDKLAVRGRRSPGAKGNGVAKAGATGKYFTMGLGILVLGLVASLWFLPRVMDWTPYKPDLQALISRQLGVAVVLNGPLNIEVLPQPRITASDVRVLGPGPRGTIRWVRGALDPAGLLRGALEPRDLALVEAKLDVPIALASAGRYEGATVARIEDGELRLLDGPAWAPRLLEHIDGTLTLGGGPASLHAFDGDARLNGQPIGISLELRAGGSLNLALTHGPSATDLAITGGPRADGRWGGRATLVMQEAAFLSTLRAEALTRILGEGPATADARFESAPDGRLTVALESIDGRRLSGAGAATVIPGDRPAIDFQLALDRMDVTDGDDQNRVTFGRDLADALKRFADIDITGRVTMARLTTALGEPRGIDIAFAAGDGRAVFERATAILPGDGNLSLFGALDLVDDGWRFEGDASLVARDPSAAIAWAAPDLADGFKSISSGQARATDISTRLLIDPSGIELTDFSGRVGDTSWGGAASIPMGNDPRPISVVLEGDTLNLDRYLGDGIGNKLDGVLEGMLSLLASERTLDINAFLDRLTVGGLPIDQASVTFTNGPDKAAEMTLYVGRLAGASGVASARIVGPEEASASLRLTLSQPDRFLGALGLPARRAAGFARLGETALRLDLSLAPGGAVGYALRAHGENGEARANGVATLGATPRLTLTDAAYDGPDMTFTALSGECTSEVAGAWTCAKLRGEAIGYRFDADASWTPGAPTGRLALSVREAALDLGLFASRAGFPLVPEGEARLSGDLEGDGADLDAAFRAVAGELTLSGEVGLSLGTGRAVLGNVERLRSNITTAFGAPNNPLDGVIRIDPPRITARVDLTGQGALLSGTAAISRATNMLLAGFDITSGGAEVVTLRADGPLSAPDIRLGGPWVTGR